MYTHRSYRHRSRERSASYLVNANEILYWYFFHSFIITNKYPKTIPCPYSISFALTGILIPYEHPVRAKIFHTSSHSLALFPLGRSLKSRGNGRARKRVRYERCWPYRPREYVWGNRFLQNVQKKGYKAYYWR